MQQVAFRIGDSKFRATFEDELAPRTCATFRSLLPFTSKLIHVRWSGEACWIPMGSVDIGVPAESATSYPEPGQILLYPGGISETEILVGYGAVRFASKAGQLAGNPLLRINQRLDELSKLGARILWNGALDILIG